MRRMSVVAVLVAVTTLAAASAPASSAPSIPPKTARDHFTYTVAGRRIQDPYHWLESPHTAQTQAWITRQDAYTHRLLAQVPAIAQVAARLRPLIAIGTVSTPVERGGRLYYLRRAADQPQAVLYTRRIGGAERVVVDPNPMSPRHVISAHLDAVSSNGELMAYAIQHGGQDQSTLHIYDAATGRDLPDVMPLARYWGVAFTAQPRGFYYIKDWPYKGPRLYFHRLGAPVRGDRLVFGRGLGTDKAMGVAISPDGRYLLITVDEGTGQTNQLYFQDRAAHGPIRPLITGLPAWFHGRLAGATLFVHTDWQAPNGRVLGIDLRHPERGNWRVVVPPGADAIQGMAAAGGRLFVAYLHDVSSLVRVFSPNGKLLRTLALPSLGSIGGISGTWSDPRIYYEFSSFTVPPTIYAADARAGAPRVWARTRAPGLPSDLITRQVWYTSTGGVRVPMFLVYRRGVEHNGQARALLTGYGGFDITLTPAWNPVAVAWAEMGGVFAQPNLRGGAAFGEAWHRAGMLSHKQNVFDDFYHAAHWLIQHRFTRPSRLAAFGGSNGGLLVGAAMTQRPRLFAAIVCWHPLLDMLRYELFPIGNLWTPEYGDPRNPKDYPYIAAYSPYQHVRPGVPYPAVLFLTGAADTRVNPLHAMKMTAEMQAEDAPGRQRRRPILLFYGRSEGHSGGEPVALRIHNAARWLGFLWWQTRQAAS
ncbi:MAG: prolyl oligopeptidase family serine peptidase [Terriglobales bacterium]